jgi:hypothetical protein
VHASQLHDALAGAHRARVALITSDEFYRAVVERGPRGLDPSTFAQVTISAQNLQRCPAWIHIVGYSWPPALTRQPEQRPYGRTDSDMASDQPEYSGAGQYGGISIAGNVEVHRDMFSGDKIVRCDGDSPKYVGDIG